MSPETEHSEEPSTLPPPELNPLLNPLLAENMGRWAQVYFTSPPEKRDEAVHELLRQLEAEHLTHNPAVAAAPSSYTAASSNASSAPVSFSAGAEPAASPASPASSLESQEHGTLVRCLACGRKNPSTQRFCGLCGTRLGEEGPVAALHRDDLRDDPPNEDVQTVDPSESRNDLRGRDIYAPSIYEPSVNTNELSLFQRSATPATTTKIRTRFCRLQALLGRFVSIWYSCWQFSWALSRIWHGEAANRRKRSTQNLPVPQTLPNSHRIRHRFRQVLQKLSTGPDPADRKFSHPL